MYDSSLTRQSLPSKEYCYLLGVALSVFSSNNSFVIENILYIEDSKGWHELIDKESGRIKALFQSAAKDDSVLLEACEQFEKVVLMRNRIIHGFRITSEKGEQVIATKAKETGEQFVITEAYLRQFINENQVLSDMLYRCRDKYAG